MTIDKSVFAELEGIALDYWDVIEAAQSEIQEIESHLNRIGFIPEMILPSYNGNDMRLKRFAAGIRVCINDRPWTENPHEVRFKSLGCLPGLPKRIVETAKKLMGHHEQ